MHVTLLIVIGASAVSAHITVVSDASGLPEDRVLDPGTDYAIPSTYYLECTLIGQTVQEGDTLNLSISNRHAFSWLDASVHEHVVQRSNCQPVSGSVGGVDPGIYNVFHSNVTIRAAPFAMAFEEFRLKPGLDGGHENSGGSVDLFVHYVPNFTAPTSLSYDVDNGQAAATIPLVMAANADSTFHFKVASVRIDDETVDSSVAITRASLDVASGVHTESRTRFAELDVVVEPLDWVESDEASGWETAAVSLDITLQAEGQPSTSSSPHRVELMFKNMVQQVESPPEPEPSTESQSTPFAPMAILAMALAALATRR